MSALKYVEKIWNCMLQLTDSTDEHKRMIEEEEEKNKLLYRIRQKDYILLIQQFISFAFFGYGYLYVI